MCKKLYAETELCVAKLRRMRITLRKNGNPGLRKLVTTYERRLYRLTDVLLGRYNYCEVKLDTLLNG